jgi:hypothetical protein
MILPTKGASPYVTCGRVTFRLKCKGDAVVACNRAIMVSHMMTLEEGSDSTISTRPSPAFSALGIGQIQVMGRGFRDQTA